MSPDTTCQTFAIPCGLGVAFLVVRPQGCYLIDTGSPGCQNKVLQKLKELDRFDLKAIWITHAHYDHYGSAAALRDITGAKIGVHPADAGSLANGASPLGSSREYGWIYPLFQPLALRLLPLPPTPPDFTLEDGELLASLGLDAIVWHTPGHTPGHSSLVLEGETAFAGDVIASVPPRLKMQSLLATNWDQLPASVIHLSQAHPQWVYTGHSRRPLPGSALQELARTVTSPFSGR